MNFERYPFSKQIGSEGCTIAVLALNDLGEEQRHSPSKLSEESLKGSVMLEGLGRARETDCSMLKARFLSL